VHLVVCSFGDDRRYESADGPDAQIRVDAQVIDTPPGIDAMAMERVFETRPEPPTAIPDFPDPGVLVSFTVTGVTFISGLEIQVNISHTFRGDLLIQLLRGTNLIATLKAQDDDSGDNVVATYPVAPSQLGTPYNGMYSVRIIDKDKYITGTINLVKLTFKVD
jgi:subtilisin-like proprotein convertase family protein